MPAWLGCLILFLFGGCEAQPSTLEPASPPAGSWTLVVLPDSQSTVRRWPEIFTSQTDWIATHADRMNIKYVVHEGDITNNSNDLQWGRADRAFRPLDGHVPYALALGNHDYQGDGSPTSRDTTKFDSFFPPGRLQAQAGFVGMLDPLSGVNAAYRFEANGRQWLILILEFGPRDSVLAWALSVLEANPRATTILVTHAYLFSDGTRFDHIAGVHQNHNPHDYDRQGRLGGANDGQELWDKLIAKSPSIRLVLCGHMHAQARLTSQRPSAPPVHQLLADYQTESLGGAGYMRLLTFGPDGSLDVKTYSPTLRRFREDPNNQFVLGL